MPELETKDEPNLEGKSETDDKGSEDTSASEENELLREVKALKSQFERSQQDNDSLREAVRLQSRLLDNQGNQKRSQISPELEEAKKILSPLFNEDLDAKLNPLAGTLSNLYDQNDAVKFQLYLQRNDADALQGDSFDRMSQVVESVRRKAANEQGTWLSRLDAYHYAKGAGLLKPAGKKAAVTSKQKEEQKQALAGNNSDLRKEGSISAEIQSIRQKAHSGIRLTPEERAKFRDFLGDTPL